MIVVSILGIPLVPVALMLIVCGGSVGAQRVQPRAAGAGSSRG